MQKLSVNPILAGVALLALSLGMRAQTAPPKKTETPKTRRRPRPPLAATSPESGMRKIRWRGSIHRGVASHAPFTKLGEDLANAYKPGDGPRRVSVGLVNDPLDGCDPAGFPRNLLFELRAVANGSDSQADADDVPIPARVARHLDRWARASEGSGSKMVWIFGGEVGGRLHVCGADGGHGRTDLARQCRRPAQRRDAASRSGTTA